MNVLASNYVSTSPQQANRNTKRMSNPIIPIPTASPSQSSFQERLFTRISQTSLIEGSEASAIDRVDEQKAKAKLDKPNTKTMSKKERRDLQEQQRAAKAAKQPQPPQGKAKPKPKPSTSPPKVEHLYKPPTNKKQLKKQSSTVLSDGPKSVTLFSHLAPYESEYNLSKEKNAAGTVHPAIVSLGVQYSEGSISGGNARCLAMLLGMHKVIADYITPNGTSLHRHLTQHISKQVDYLTNTRPLAPSMKTAIRFLKSEIAGLDASHPDEDVIYKLILG
jgi:translation initiation factor eIF-2B subunit delta